MTDIELWRACNTIVARGFKPTLSEVRPLIKAFLALPGNGCGGALHIVLEDGNWERSAIIWCQGYAAARGDKTAVALGEVLLMLSNSQRRRVC